MKIALCFSGQMRDLNESKNFWLELIKKYDIDVYASFWDIENSELGDTIKEFQKVYSPKKIEVESYDIFKESTQDIASLYIQPPTQLEGSFIDASKKFNQLPMYYKIWKCNMLTKELGIKYDVVIRARIDIVLDENFNIVSNKCLNIPMGTNMVTTFNNSDGINDCFAFGTPKIMDYYSFIYLQLMEYLSKGHYMFPPEHLLAIHFSKIHIPIRFFPNYMMITRVSKNQPHEIYNKFLKEPIEFTMYASEFINKEPDGKYTFRKDSIKNDFIV